MKSKNIIYPAVLVLVVLVPLLRYYSSTPEVNACVADYVEDMETSNNKWLIYDIDWRYHIEPENSIYNDSLGQYLVWESRWCMMYSGNLFNDLNNTIYCSITYLIKHAPIHDDAKEQLGLYKSE